MAIGQEFGEAIKCSRKRKRLTQEQVASAAGIDRTYLSTIENGAVNITLNLAEKLAVALDESLVDVLSSYDKKKSLLSQQTSLLIAKHITERYAFHLSIDDVRHSIRAIYRERTSLKAANMKLYKLLNDSVSEFAQIHCMDEDELRENIKLETLLIYVADILDPI